MTALRKTLAVVAVAMLVGLAGLAFALSQGIELSWSRDWLAARLSESLERQLVISGPFRLTVGRRTLLEAADVTLANAEWAAGPELARARRVELELDLWSLLRGPLLIHRLEIDDARVTLERAVDGTGNWPMLGGEDDEDGPAVLVEEIDLQAVRVTYAGPALSRPIATVVDVARQRYGPSGDLLLSLRGTLNGEPLELTAESSPPAVWIAGRDIELRLALRLAEGRLDGNARIDDLARPARPAADLKLSAPDAARAFELLGLPYPGAGPLEAALRLTPQPDELGLSLDLAAGELTARFTGDVESLAGVRGLDADLVSSGTDFSVLGRPLGWADAPPGPFTLEGTVRSDGASLSIEQALLTLAGMQLEVAAAIDGLPEPDLRRLRLSLRGEQLQRLRELLGVPGLVDGPFTLSAAVDEQADGIDHAEVTIQSRLGRFQASGRLGEYPQFLGTTAQARVEGTDLAGLGALAGIAGLPATTFTAQGQLTWTRSGLGLQDVTLRTDREQLSVSGTVAPDPLGRGTDLEVKIAGDALGRLGPALRLGELPAVPYAAAGRLSRLGRGTRLQGVRATLGDVSLRIDGAIADPPELSGTDLQFDVNGDELRRWNEFAGLSLPEGPFRASGQLRLDADAVVLRQVGLELGGARGRVNADIQLPFGAGRGDFSATLAGPDLAKLLPELGELDPARTPFELELRGNWRGERWFFEQARLQAGGDELSARGALRLGADAATKAMPVTLRIQSLERVGTLVGLDLPDLALTLDGTLAGRAGELRLDPMLGRLGPDAFTGRLSVTPGDPPRLALTLRLDRADIGPLLATGPTTGAAEVPSAQADRRLIPDVPIPTDWLRSLDAALDLHVASLVLGDVLYGALDLKAEISNDALTIDRLRLAGPVGAANLRARLSGSGDTPRLNVTGTLRNVVFVYRVLATESPDPPRNDVDLRLRGEGGTLRDLLGKLNGELRIIGGPGIVPASAVDALYTGFFRTVTRAVNPFSKTDKFVREVCSVAPLTIRNGVISTAPTFVKLTDKLNTLAFGTIDLKNERVDLNFKTELRKGIGIGAAELVNPYIKVGGTLADPRVKIDPKGVAFSGGAAVLTGGLSILATTLWNRAFREKDPCGAVLQAANRAEEDDGERRRVVDEVDKFFELLE